MKHPFFEKRPLRAGFTLIEITLGVALAAVVGVVVFSTFSSGLRLWQRHQEGFPARDTAFLFERMQRDFENGSEYTTWVLRGNATQCEFPAFVGSITAQEGRMPAPARVLYFWDGTGARVLRSVTSLSDDFQGILKDGKAVLSGVERFVFSYYFLDPQRNEYVWSEQWPSEEAVLKEGAWPLAVRLEVSVRYDKRIYEAVKIFSLPLGG